MKTIIHSRIVRCLLLALILGGPLEKAFGGKPKPPPLLPPLRYHIQYWTIPNAIPTSININGMDNLGHIVGWYVDLTGHRRAYLYDPELDLDSAVDLETLIVGAGVPDGWQIIGALDINDQGIVVGALSPLNDEGVNFRAGFVIDIHAPVPQVVLLPNFGGWEYAYARQINDNGDILGVYENPDGSSGLYFYNPSDANSPYYLDNVPATAVLNNPVGMRPAQVGGTFASGAPFRWTPQSNQVTTFGSFLTSGGIRGMNDSGILCGSLQSGRPAVTYLRLSSSSYLPFLLTPVAP